MSNLFGKIRDFVGLPGAEEYDEYEYDDEMMAEDGYEEEYEDVLQPIMAEERETPASSTPADSPSKLDNVVGMPGTGRFWSGAASEVLVMEPKSFEEMPRVIQALRDRKSVVLNLTMMDAVQAQRAVDFVAGATFTIDGHQERVGESIFLFTPNCVQVRTQATPPQSGTVHPAPQAPATSNISTTSWQNDLVMSQIAQ
ncbi:cell division protein SepF [Lyngbya confervoides]|uniref:Cell division protein SepF n=1 Tax=Lyngbya confervoides BDU141951 TaxID=1574623 RepID=A0ABD4T8R8_9CYAN|nr:cell division protein SepF [Lyngbya confervoides]MCM1985041.1 cell division protein SepF [Lyngbya confervoides BDU141951]